MIEHSCGGAFAESLSLALVHQLTMNALEQLPEETNTFIRCPGKLSKQWHLGNPKGESQPRNVWLKFLCGVADFKVCRIENSATRLKTVAVADHLVEQLFARLLMHTYDRTLCSI